MCRDEKLRENVLNDLRNAFRSVCSYKLEEDVNEILYCRNDTQSQPLKLWQTQLEQSSKSLNDVSKLHKVSVDELVDVEDFLKDLKL